MLARIGTSRQRNILTLARNGKYKATPTASCWTDGQTDNLAYTYYPGYNRLQKIADSAPAASKAEGWNNPANASSAAVYGYDASGNMNADPYKGMNITYNHLNLPTLITFAGGSKKIELLYSGNGAKLRKTVSENNVLQYRQDYNSGLEYRSTGTTVSLSLESILHAEGRVLNTNVGTSSADALRYEYTIRDHLGSARLSFADKNNNGIVEVSSDGSSEILQENHYYPFGMEMNGPWSNDAAALDNLYKYNGIERNNDFALNMDLALYRAYDPVIGRWWQIDPKINLSLNPYVGFENNPVVMVDMLGDTVKFAGKSEEAAYMEYVAEVAKRAAAIDKEIANARSNLTGKSLERKLKKLNRSRDVYTKIQQEINDLESSDEIFRIRIGANSTSTSEGAGGSLRYNTSTKEIDVNLSTSSDFSEIQRMAHELTHAAQYVSRDLDLRRDGGHVLLYDQSDEVEAYERGNLFHNPSSSYSIFISDPREYVMNSQKYKSLAAGPISFRNLSPSVQQQLLQEIRSSSAGNVTPRILISGWKRL
ncbi:MAG: hypothetical protein J0L99_13150 [Chitinophagales bacterium]|nr:hypothetical protein [Chitinophagales bacterium]